MEDAPDWRLAGLGAFDGRGYLFDQGVEVFVHVVLPDPDHPPSSSLEGQRLPPVARCVLDELVGPELAVAAGPHVVDWAAVPLAPIHEDCDLRAQEDHVGTPDRCPGVDAVAQSGGPEGLPKSSLGLCVLPADAGHVLGASDRHGRERTPATGSPAGRGNALVDQWLAGEITWILVARAGPRWQRCGSSLRAGRPRCRSAERPQRLSGGNRELVLGSEA